MHIERPKSKQPIPEHAKRVFRGVVFDVYQWDQELYDGTRVIFEKAKRKDTVIVFPVLPDGRIILTKQEQPGKEPFVGATGGRVDEGEDVLEAAKRELLEESGYEASEMMLWRAQNSSPKVDWAVYIFIAKGLKKVTDINLDGGEKIELMSITFDEFLEIPFREDIYFAEQEIVFDLMKAKLDPKKRAELEDLFKP